jgi:hypothetical protein
LRTVFSLMPSRLPIVPLSIPSATSCNTCSSRIGRLRPDQLALFQGVRLGTFNRQGSLSGMALLLGY